MSEDSTTDCRSEAGITVGLVDSIISIARVLKPRLREMCNNGPPDHAIIQALEDLNTDEDIAYILREAETAEHRCTTERCFCGPPDYLDEDYYPDSPQMPVWDESLERADPTTLNAVMPQWAEQKLGETE